MFRSNPFGPGICSRPIVPDDSSREQNPNGGRSKRTVRVPLQERPPPEVSRTAPPPYNESSDGYWDNWPLFRRFRGNRFSTDSRIRQFVAAMPIPSEIANGDVDLDWQLAIALVFVLWAVWLLVRRGLRLVTGHARGGCHSAGTGCSGCTMNAAQSKTNAPSGAFVSLDAIQISPHHGPRDRCS